MDAIISFKPKEYRNLVLFGAGKSVSIFGTSIYSFAIGLYVLELTGSALNFATTIMLGIIPMVLISPVAGVVADRIPKKWLVVGMDLANGCLFFVLYGLALSGHFNLFAIYVSTVLLNVLTTFFGIGIEAAKPNLVMPDKRVKLNALGKLIDSSAAILAPILGGMIYAFLSIEVFILINGVSFILSALSEWFIDYGFYSTQDKDQVEGQLKTTFKKDLIEGGRYFFASKGLMELFYVFVSLNFLLGFSVNVPGPYIMNQMLKLPSEAFGLICALFPVGLIIGTLTVEKWMKRFKFKALLIVMNGFIALIASIIGLPTLFSSQLSTDFYIVYYGGIHLLMGISIAYVDVPIMTILQDEIPEALRGRVLSLLMSLVKVVLPVALILSGYMINRIPLVFIPIIGSSIAFGYSLYLLNKFKRAIKSV